MILSVTLLVVGALAAPPPGFELIIPDEVGTASSPGSLYEEQASREVTGVDLNTWRRGDIVRVLVLENTNTDLGSKTHTGVDTETAAEISLLFGADLPQLGVGVDVSPSIGVGGERKRNFDGDGRTQSDSNVQTTVACQVVEVLPGGNLVIRGWKETRVNRETQYVTLQGIIRPRDITMDGAVRSDQVAQASVEVTGRGVVADTQGPGLATRVIDRVWPF